MNADIYSNRADGVAIVCHPTGIIWTTQVGGHACYHPEIEGFVLTIFDNGPARIDDCEWGCFGHKTDDEYCESYGQAIDEFLSKSINESLGNYAKYKFDYDRKNEVMEGWWPVLVEFTGCIILQETKVFKGYLHMGNCD